MIEEDRSFFYTTVVNVVIAVFSKLSNCILGWHFIVAGLGSDPKHDYIGFYSGVKIWLSV
jgi:hypothetical protein